MKVIAEFREPVKGYNLKLAYFGVDELERPVFQRDLSDSLRKQLEITIEKLGFLTPIVVVPKDSRYYVVDGMHRLEAMKSLGAREIIGVVIDERLYHYILDFNTEKPPTVKDKAKQAYRLYQDLLGIYPDRLEEDFYSYFRDPSLITLGFTVEEVNSRFPVSFFDDFVSKIDRFLSLPLSEAARERKRRANLLEELNGIVVSKYVEFQFDNPLLKGEIVRKTIQKAYGIRVRMIEDDFEDAVRKVIETCQSLTLEDLK